MVAMKRIIDLNADLGEDNSPEGTARDIAIMDIVSSCNIACGGHAGSPDSMRTMLTAAKARKLSAGAHPSYPDRVNFGRVSMDMEPAALKADLLRQVTMIQEIATEVGTSITHLKPHGALYNDAQDDELLAEILVEVAQSQHLPLVSMAGSAVHEEAKEAKLAFLSEAFIDRRYTERARLLPRSQEGAVIADDGERIRQALALAKGEPVTTAEGTSNVIQAETLCLHSDSDGALATAKAVRRALELEEISITSDVRCAS